MKKKPKRGPHQEFDAITATADGRVVWRRYGDGLLFVARKDETPDQALARHLLSESGDDLTQLRTWMDVPANLRPVEGIMQKIMVYNLISSSRMRNPRRLVRPGPPAARDADARNAPGGIPRPREMHDVSSSPRSQAAATSTMALMANSPDQPQPATHGQVHVSDGHSNPKALAAQMQDHFAQHVQHLNTTASYHKGVGVTGQDAGGSFTASPSGADYETTSTGNTGDADSGGRSGY
ncbi:MAG: hypothetical protein WAM04_09915 [Candidatus Sulfotelmatobacter sp.]